MLWSGNAIRGIVKVGVTVDVYALVGISVNSVNQRSEEQRSELGRGAVPNTFLNLLENDTNLKQVSFFVISCKEHCNSLFDTSMWFTIVNLNERDRVCVFCLLYECKVQ